MTRDLSTAQFRRACRRHGFIPDSMGYYGLAGTPISVYARNGGDRRRSQLAYMIREQAKAVEKYPPNPTR